MHNLIEQRFGRLVVILKTHVVLSGKKQVRWKCICDCGNTSFVGTPDLLKGKTKSCGCLMRELASQKARVHLVGKKFGRLLVVSEHGFTKKGKICWDCKCDCGNECIVESGPLGSGHTKSCGCLQKELTSKRRKLDLSGKRFGNLVAISDNGRNSHGSVMWLCKCYCGKECVVSSTNLQEGKQISCGCWKIRITSQLHRNDLTGQRFNRLTVLRQIGLTTSHKLTWECKCDCGTIVTVIGSNLISGGTKSCGCLQKEKVKQILLKKDTTQGWFKPSKSATLFLDMVEKIFGITMIREYRLVSNLLGKDYKPRFFDGCYKDYLIEIDNSYWHKSSQENDAYKDLLAKQNGFHLIRCNVENVKDVPYKLNYYMDMLQQAFGQKVLA